MAANQGEVEIPFDGGVATLRCTLRASKEVCAYFGNFVNANDRLISLDPTALTALVAAGLGKSTKEVEEQVFNAGLMTLKPAVERWMNLLANGGKPYRVLNANEHIAIRESASDFVRSLPGYKDTPLLDGVVGMIVDGCAQFLGALGPVTEPQDEPKNV